MEITHSYRKNEQSSDDSSDNNSDSDTFNWKRSKPQEVSNTLTVPLIKHEKKVNNVWGAVLQEQNVSDCLGQLGFVKKPITMQDRTCESYDFRRKLYDDREEIPIDDEEMDTTTKSSVAAEDKKKYVHLNSADLAVSKKIAWKLSEKKQYLISRVVHFLGASKAMELLKQTEEIEDEGGMLVMNNTRRRTPGGVYFQLLKKDKDITKEQIKNIFLSEECFADLKKRKALMNKKKKKKVRERNAQHLNSVNMQTSAVPSSTVAVTSNLNPVAEADLSPKVKQRSSDSEIEEGEITD